MTFGNCGLPIIALLFIAGGIVAGAIFVAVRRWQGR